MFGREGSAKDRASEENEEKVEDEEAGPASEVRVEGGDPPRLPKLPAHTALPDALADRTYRGYLCVSEARIPVCDHQLL